MNITLEQWSLIIFSVSVVMYLAAFNSMFNKPSVKKIIFLIFAWFIRSIVVLCYGILTDQIGFIMLVGYEFVMMFFVYSAAKREYLEK